MNPLHTPELLAAAKLLSTTDRRTGRTTAIAFRLIGEAIASPRKLVAIRDHLGERRADEHLARLVKDIIGATGLREMHVNMSQLTLSFDRVLRADYGVSINGVKVTATGGVP